MRFRFCGELDCPDWVLAGINILSRLSSLKLRSLCASVCADLLDDESVNMPQLERTTADARLSGAELRAAVSVLGFVMESAVKHHVAAGELRAELQQLGLPREHAAAVGRVLDQNSARLLERLRRRVLRYPAVTRVDWDVSTEVTSEQLARPQPRVLLRVATSDQQTDGFSMDLTTARLLSSELARARRRMDDVAA